MRVWQAEHRGHLVLLEVALVDRQVHWLAIRPAAVVEVPSRVMRRA
jgi:hypothetical protein